VLFLININVFTTMKHLSLLLFFILPFTLKTSAQTATQQQKAQIKALVQKIADATVKEDYKTVLAYTHPKLLNAFGGNDKMLLMLRKTFSELKKQGIVLKGFTISEPGDVVTAGARRFSVVPQTITMQMPGKLLSQQSYTLAISEDQGKHWFFINPKGGSDAQLLSIFPEVKGKLTIPKPGQPVFTPDAG
jgi:hypothetical protein